jgi:hypothetical protein
MLKSHLILIKVRERIHREEFINYVTMNEDERARVVLLSENDRVRLNEFNFCHQAAQRVAENYRHFVERRKLLSKLIKEMFFTSVNVTNYKNLQNKRNSTRNPR